MYMGVTTHIHHREAVVAGFEMWYPAEWLPAP